MNAVKYLPEKYNEIMNLFFNNEIRVYLPIQELNILLEPIRRRDEPSLEEERDEIRLEDLLGFEDEEESEMESDEEEEPIENEDQKEETDLKQRSDSDEDLTSSDNDSNSSIENLNSIDF